MPSIFGTLSTNVGYAIFSFRGFECDQSISDAALSGAIITRCCVWIMNGFWRRLLSGKNDAKILL